MVRKKVLFLTLKVFGFTGGIEKVCRIICRALYDLGQEEIVDPLVYSMYDKRYDRDSRYLKKSQFRGFEENRKLFVVKSFFKGIGSDTVLLSHVNLLSIGYLIKRFRPKTKVYLLAHGIEIWKRFPEAKLKALRRLDGIIAVSHFTAEKIRTIHGISPEKISVLNNCLDPFYYFPTEFSKPEKLLNRYNLTKEYTIMMSLSRLSSSEKYKGYDNIIAILPKLIKKYPKLVYLIAGKYDDEEKLRIDKLINTHKMSNHIKVIGFVDEAEVSDHFLLSDIFVLPSKKEGFGIVFIEAMASGLTVIAGNKDGSVDALCHGELGYLVNPDDLSEIENSIAKAMDAAPTHNEKIELQRRVFEIFSYEAYKRHLQKLIQYDILK